MSGDAAVMAHYATSDLLGRIDAALRAAGKDVDNLTPDDLSPLEHMHTGGLRLTREAVRALRLGAGDRAVDIGCGIGGTSRELARQVGVRVTGIDLTPELIEVARELSRRTGFGPQTRFEVGSALALPLEDASAHGAALIHVGMNIADKTGLLREAARVLKPGGRLALWEVMLGDVSEPIRFPVPWASTPETSHLASPAEYRAAAADAGLIPVSEEEYYTETIRPETSMTPEPGPLPTLGPHLMMGDNAQDKIRNHRDNLNAGGITPVQMVFRKPD